MKKIEVVVHHEQLNATSAVLKQLDLGGLTYYDSKGRGQIPRPQLQSGRGTSTYTPEFNTNSTIVLIVKDAIFDKVINRILENTSTGRAGEGKIFVSEVEDAIDIGSRTRGEDAI